MTVQSLKNLNGTIVYDLRGGNDGTFTNDDMTGMRMTKNEVCTGHIGFRCKIACDPGGMRCITATCLFHLYILLNVWVFMSNIPLANVKYQQMYPIMAKTERQICSRTAINDCSPVLLQDRKKGSILCSNMMGCSSPSTLLLPSHATY